MDCLLNNLTICFNNEQKISHLSKNEFVIVTLLNFLQICPYIFLSFFTYNLHTYILWASVIFPQISFDFKNNWQQECTILYARICFWVHFIFISFYYMRSNNIREIKMQCPKFHPCIGVHFVHDITEQEYVNKNACKILYYAFWNESIKPTISRICRTQIPPTMLNKKIL